MASEEETPVELTPFQERTKEISSLLSLSLPPSPAPILPDQDLILVHTNLTVSLLNFPSFGMDNSKVNAQLAELQARPESPLLFLGLMAKPWALNFETVTVWRDTKELASFYMTGDHRTIMKKWKDSLILGETADTDRYVVKYNQLPKEYSELNLFWKKVKNRSFPKWMRKPL